MKKTLLLIAVAFFAAFSTNAQDLTLSWDGQVLGDTVYVWGEPTDAEIVFHAIVHNNTDNGMNIKVRRNRITLLDGTDSQFCWGLCYPPSTDESPEPILIFANSQSGDEDFSAHYNPNTVIGTSVIEYTFFNMDNEDQFVKVVAKFWASPAGVAEDAMQGGSISDIYPNPATNTVNLDYNLPAQVETASVRIVNLLGSVVKETQVERNGTKLTMDISDLNGGIYFYTVIVNGEVYKTKKLVVQK